MNNKYALSKKLPFDNSRYQKFLLTGDVLFIHKLDCSNIILYLLSLPCNLEVMFTYSKQYIYHWIDFVLFKHWNDLILTSKNLCWKMWHFLCMLLTRFFCFVLFLQITTESVELNIFVTITLYFCLLSYILHKLNQIIQYLSSVFFTHSLVILWMYTLVLV